LPSGSVFDDAVDMADMRLLVRGRGRDIAASSGTGATPRVGMTAVAADLSITIVRIDAYRAR
jgi:hypothetical protein